MLTIWSVVCTAEGRRRLEAKQAVQVGDHAGQIKRFRRRLLLHGVDSQIGALKQRLAQLYPGWMGVATSYFGAGPGNKSSILPVSR
jgi:hypothetical protein